MDSPQSVVSPFKSSPVSIEPEKQRSDFFLRNPDCLSGGIEVHSKGSGMVYNMDGFVGSLEVYVHQARDIHNICIYHKQDVYAKICLTSDPENAVSTKIINGGGQNPVFNDNLRLNVRTMESSLKCEIWMLSRVKNYLEDQLLGFALVPLSEVLLNNGKLEKEFGLSSTDLFHSPAGFVRLSLSYSGASPDVMAIPALPVTANAASEDTEISESMPSDFDAIEFPDPKIMNENQLMVSEYFGIPCTNLDSQSSEETLDDESHHSTQKTGAQAMESFSEGTIESAPLPKLDSPPSSVSTNGSPSASLPASSVSSDASETSKSPNGEHVSPPKEKNSDNGDGETDSSGDAPSDIFPKPSVTVNIEPEQKVVQQDIVDMYMKSMQQFTESLAKMKLPMDIETGTTNSGNSSSDQKLQAAAKNNNSNNNNNSSRVFYGSRAFF